MPITTTNSTTWVSDANPLESVTFDPAEGPGPTPWARLILIVAGPSGEPKQITRYIDSATLALIVGEYPGLGE